MFERFLRGLRTMDLEEQIFHAAVLITMLGVLLPWFGGRLADEAQLWNGFSYYTAYIGQFVFLLELFLFIITLSPMLGGPIIVRKTQRSVFRLLSSILIVCLLIAAFSVLIRINAEMPNYSVRLGMFIAIIAGFVQTLYSFLRYQQSQKDRIQETFRHPEDEKQVKKSPEQEEGSTLPPPPPPSPPPPEDHRHYTHIP